MSADVENWSGRNCSLDSMFVIHTWMNNISTLSLSSRTCVDLSYVLFLWTQASLKNNIMYRFELRIERKQLFAVLHNL